MGAAPRKTTRGKLSGSTSQFVEVRTTLFCLTSTGQARTRYSKIEKTRVGIKLVLCGVANDPQNSRSFAGRF